MKKFLFIIFILTRISLLSEIRAVWVPIWELSSPEKIDHVVSECKKYQFNQILAEVRYRGDALYFANKRDSTFRNPEKLSYVVKDPLFDPLEYLIMKGKEYKIEIHAWTTMYVITPHKLDLLNTQHIFFQHPEWITYEFNKSKMDCKSFEGAYLDPGLPDVRNYLYNVIMDIVVNYDIDGIHLDYIRYPDMEFGYHAESRAFFKKEIQFQDAESWQKWKIKQINILVKQIYEKTKAIKPEIEVTAAVISELDKAKERYAQNWLDWLKNDYIDRVYLMAYTKFTDEFQTLVDSVSNYEQNKKIVIGLRSWDNLKIYRAEDINKKMVITKKNNFAGIALFSFTGLIQNNYFPKIRMP